MRRLERDRDGVTTLKSHRPSFGLGGSGLNNSVLFTNNAFMNHIVNIQQRDRSKDKDKDKDKGKVNEEEKKKSPRDVSDIGVKGI